MISYLSRHLQVLFSTLGDMARTPINSINTILVIAITLLLPCLFYVLVQTATSMGSNWQGRPQFTIFLEKDISESKTQLIFEEIQFHPDVELAELLSPSEALAEFKILASQGGNTNIDNELAFIGENPLPASIVVMPNQRAASSDAIASLKSALLQFDGVDEVKLDLAWTDRFNAIVATAKTTSLFLSGLLALGLILIVSNTIKLLIFNRRHEIEITKLVGGTHAFVRRPFLYFGSLFGFFGALLALFLVLAAAQLTAEPLRQLAQAYQTSGILYQLTIQDIGITLLAGAVLGWLSARWAVAQHLRHIKPR